ncbi:hypothetical protein [Thalassotalea sp. ND16A]|uniref:hypothetical protein n=1 Tax=Thalassotalea sp. ND16A TaxID=1535422 RepID=UPI00051A279B|nr:hypothetical protein [Thalassotalea sp. ND16A]KGJ98001.1 hypothetical protein ND16A_0806 [Thalassotalea sp. ND16A]
MMEFILLFSSISVLIVGLSWVGEKFNLDLNLARDHLALTNELWFDSTSGKTNPSAAVELHTLKQRVATLEAIITDKKYQLDEELRQL